MVDFPNDLWQQYYMSTANDVPGDPTIANGANYNAVIDELVATQTFITSTFTDNAVANATPIKDVSGWATYADAAGATPVDGTGGSATVTWARSSTSPLSLKYNFLLTKDAANRQGEGVAYTLTLPLVQQSATTEISFEYSSGGSYVTGDCRVYVYDITGTALITPDVVNISSGTGVFSTVFAATSSSQYRLVFHVATTNASAWTLKINRVRVGRSTSLDPDLVAIAALGSTGYLRRSNTNTWVLDTAISATTLTATGLTPTRIPIVTTGGLLTDAASLTLTTTSGADLLVSASGTSTATSAVTSGFTQTITYTGVATTNKSSVSGTTTFTTGNTNTAAAVLAAGIFSNSITAPVTNATVAASQSTLTATPSGAVGAINFYGSLNQATVSSAANVFFASASLIGAQVQATFNTANTTGAAVAAVVAGLKIVPSVVTTNASGTNTIASVYGAWVAPGSFTSSGGGGLTIANYYGLYITNPSTSVMTLTNIYGVYQAGSTVKNLFAGYMGIGGATPSNTTCLILAASTTTVSSLRLPHGSAPTSPTNGDVWTTSSGIYAYISGTTVGPFGVGGTATSGRVAYGSGTNTLTSSASFTYSESSFPLLTVGGKIVATHTSSGIEFTTAVISATLTANDGGNATSFTYIGINATLTDPNSNVSSSSMMTGINVSVQPTPKVGYDTITGIYNYVNSLPAGAITVNAITGIDNYVRSINNTGSAAPITTLYGVRTRVELPSSAGTMSVTDLYGIRLDVTSVSATITNCYGIYQTSSGIAARNYLQDGLGISTLPSASTYLILGASTTSVSSLRLPHGSAPSAPVDGDVWTTTAGLYARINAATVGPFGTIGGSIAATQIAYGSGTNTITGASTLTLTTTSGAALLVSASGTSTATSVATAGFTQTITYTGIATTNKVSVSATASFTTGNTNTAAAVLAAGYFANVITAPLTSATVAGSYSSVSASPSGAVGATNFNGAVIQATRNSTSDTFFASASLVGANILSTFNTANTSGATVAAAVIGAKIVPSVVSTNATGTNTITAVYGLWVAPGTFSSSGGGGMTLTSYYGLFLGTLTLSTMTATNKYGIYQEDPAATNSFAGTVVVTGSPTTTRTQVSHTLTISGNGSNTYKALYVNNAMGVSSTPTSYTAYAADFNCSHTTFAAGGSNATMYGLRAAAAIGHSHASTVSHTQVVGGAFTADSTASSSGTLNLTTLCGVDIATSVGNSGGTNNTNTAIGLRNITSHNSGTVTDLYGIYQVITVNDVTTTVRGISSSTTVPAAFGGTTFVGLLSNMTMTSGTASTTATTVAALLLDMVVNVGSTLGYNGIKLTVTETSIGSGACNLMDLRVGGNSKFVVTNAGSMTTTGSRVVGTQSITSSAGTTVLSATNHYVCVTGSTTHTLTLPAAAAGRLLMLKNRSSGTVTVNRAGSDTIDGGTTYSLTTGTAVMLVANGTDWTVSGKG